VVSSTTRRAVAIAALFACAAAERVRAEDVEAPPPVVAPPAPPPPGQISILPAEKSADLMAHWAQRREYLRERDQRRAEDEEQRVRQLKDELALENVFGVAAALVRESHETLAAESPALARKACKLAVELAPALPAAHICLARATLAEDPSTLSAAGASALAALRAALADPAWVGPWRSTPEGSRSRASWARPSPSCCCSSCAMRNSTSTTCATCSPPGPGAGRPTSSLRR